jgi:hypothetical protein
MLPWRSVSTHDSSKGRKKEEGMKEESSKLKNEVKKIGRGK